MVKHTVVGTTSTPQTIRVGGASGYWGESDMALPQLLATESLDYVVFDYLAEITMSILARARSKRAEAGYATDFVSAVLKPNVQEIARQNVKIVSNAGGVNPVACGHAVRELIQQAGLDLKVAVIAGDDLLHRASDLATASYKEMFTGEHFPEPESLTSVNAYTGAFPIAKALAAGADIVITGRVVDSACTLGACIHAFGWLPDALDQLAGGSLAGHILECGPQATGGNYTDWDDVSDTMAEVGYPIAEIAPDGSFTVEKPEHTGGAVSFGTVGEQMLYEIGDPSAYRLPDVICDFSQVHIQQMQPDLVQVSGARGRAAPTEYKVCATWADGWRAGTVVFFYGDQAPAKARAFAASSLKRARHRLRAANLPDYTEHLIEVMGDESHYGSQARATASREATVKLAVKHPEQAAASLLLKEASGIGLAAPPGLTMFAGGRAKASPVVRLFSFLIPRSEIQTTIDVDGALVSWTDRPGTSDAGVVTADSPEPPAPQITDEPQVPVLLRSLAWARSGDKGNTANIGVLPRKHDYGFWIWNSLTSEQVQQLFQHFLPDKASADLVQRYYMPGTGAINLVLDQVLGGGGIASLRNDPQGKSYGQILLEAPIKVPQSLAAGLPLA
ncbi:MAG: acyclic terpene utilization AtuA family protein [Gammaproteobacteria bacterium]